MTRITQFILSLRNPSFKDKLLELQQVYALDPKGIELHQTQKLRELVVHFSKNDRSFEAVLTKNHIDPHKIQLDELKSLPKTSKADLIERFSELNQADLFSRVYKAKTSGTSGVGFNFDKDEEWDSFVRASREYFLNQVGQSSFSKAVYFWGFSYGLRKRILTRILDFVLNRKRFFSYKMLRNERFLKTLQNSNLLIGYSSMVNSAAEYVIEKGYTIDMAAIVATSERVLPHYYENVQKAFGKNLLSEYGAAETGIIAFSCSYGIMHVNEAGVIVEMDENGEILVTNLNAKSLPIIRYKLGDYISLEVLEKPCRCGRFGSVIKDIKGRVGETIVGKKAEYPSLTLYYIFKSFYESRSIYLSFTAEQNEIGLLQLYLEKELNSADHKFLKKIIESYFLEDISVEIIVDASRFIASKKRRDFISKIVR